MNAFEQMVSTISKKPDEGALSVVVTFRASERQRQFVNRMGGPAYLRDLVAQAMAEEAKNTDDD